VIRENLDLVGSPFAVASPVFEGVVYCQDFLVVDFLVDLHMLELSGMECHWVKTVFLVSL